MVAGERVNLRKLEKEDISRLIKWMSSQDFSYYLYGSPLDSLSEIEQKISRLIEGPFSVYDSSMHFIIETKKSEPIGLVTFFNISWKNRNLNVEVMIGKKEHRNKFYGVDAYLTALKFIFQELNMHKVVGYVNQYNQRSIKIAERGGAKCEGTLRKHIFINGKYYDLYIYGLLKKEYLKLTGELKKLRYWKNKLDVK